MTIYTKFTPNIQGREVMLSIVNFFAPKKGKALTRLRELIEHEFNMVATFYDCGRSALYEILDALDANEKDEVLVQAFTCVVVPAAILKAGYKPVYVDTDRVNMRVEDLKDKITTRTKALIVQHTFGFPDEMDAIRELCDQHNIFLIEDLAHSLTGRNLGTYGDAAFLSFGSTKIISCSRGGVALTKNLQLDPKSTFQKSTWKHHFKHITFAGNMPIYFSIGKPVLYLWSKLGLIPRVMTKAEKEGRASESHALPNSLAKIALSQWQKKEKFFEHRHKIAKIYDAVLDLDKIPYDKDAAYMVYPIFVDNPDELFAFMKANKILLGNEWSGSVIVPRDADSGKVGYQEGSCPNAEKMAMRCINLPTHIHINEKQAHKIANKIKEFYAN